MPSPQNRPRTGLKFAALAFAFAALILFVSLFPFRFRAPAGVFQTFARSFGFRPDPFDFLANILLYLPIGYFGALSLPRAPRPVRLVVPALLGTLLSFCVEMVQTFDATRRSNIWDLTANSLGTFLGAMAGLFVARPSVFPAVMVMCWTGFRAVSPYVPAAIASETRKLQAAHFSLAWLSVALLLEPLTSPRYRRFAPALLLLFAVGVQFWLSGEFPLAEACGGALAVGLWGAVVWRARWRVPAIAGAIALYVLIDALRPFYFLAHARHFGWIPFLSIIQSNRQSLISSIFAKVFMYGTLLWTLRRAGMTVSKTILAGTCFIFLSRLTQIYIPGRTAEITDTAITLLLGGCLLLMDRASSANGKSDETVTHAADGE